MGQELDDELSAIEAIYPETTNQLAPQLYSFKIPNNEDVEVQLSFPNSYPEEAPQVIQVISHDIVKYSDTKYLERSFIEKLQQVYRVNEVCLFEFLSELEMDLEEYKTRVTEVKETVLEKLKSQEKPQAKAKEDKPKQIIDPLAGWIQSDPVIDRGSSFIGFVRKVETVEEAQQFLDLLLTDRKISKAAHNISAWRIKGKGNVQYQDCDDDGETAAGGRLLHLLTVCTINKFLWNEILTFR